jgi:phenylpyruvate tautomerase PptA (4-oxalocrotonate tautomerase family)
MPYLEILGPPAAPAARAALARAATDAIMAGFGVGPETVTIYFLPVAAADYAHAGAMGSASLPQRIFVKVHAFRRDADRRRTVAASLTKAVAASLDAAPETVAVYFLDRSRDEVAHAGHLASD